MTTVLVLTDHEDYTADLIVKQLHERGAQVVRLDPGSATLRIEATLAAEGWRDLIGDEHRAARLEGVTSVLWRWPTPPAGHPGIAHEPYRRWAAREDTLALYGLLRTLQVRWVKPPRPDRCREQQARPARNGTVLRPHRPGHDHHQPGRRRPGLGQGAS